MARVSRTTYEKREIRDMLSQSSEVHFDPSMESLDTNNKSGLVVPDGVSLLGEFTGFTRCAAVVKSHAASDVTVSEVWVGDQDGRIRVRSAANGALLSTNSSQEVPPVPQTYLAAMVQCGQHEMWCAYGDGYVRAYDIQTKAKLFEKKKHAGAVTCIATFGDYVFTGSEDFKILVWSVSAKRQLTSFLGHKNHVRALVVHEGRLYSSGADGIVRCWSIKDESEVVSQPFPLRITNVSSAVQLSPPTLNATLSATANGHHSGHGHGHAQAANSTAATSPTAPSRTTTTAGSAHPVGVTALHIMDGYLFTATAEEVTLRRLDTGDVAHVIPMDTKAAKIVSISVCDATVTLWFGLSDGTVRIYDLFNYDHIGVIHEHSNTVVPTITPIARSTVNRVMILTETGMTSLTAATDALVPDYDPFRRGFTIANNDVNERRAKLAANADVVVLRKAQLRSLRRYDENQRKAVAQTMAKHQAAALTLRFTQQHMDYLVQRRNLAKRIAVAEALAQFNRNRLLFRAFAAWTRSGGASGSGNLKTRLAGVVSKSTQQNLVIRHTAAAAEAQRRYLNVKRRAASAEQLATATSRGLARSAFRRWREFRDLKRSSSEAVKIAVSAIKRNNTIVADTRLWTSIVNGTENIRVRRLLVAAASLVVSSNARVSARHFHTRWLKWTRLRKLMKRRTVLASKVAGHVDSAVRRHALLALATHARTRQVTRRTEAAQASTKRVAELEAILSDPELKSEEELDAAIADAEKAVVAAEEEVQLIEKRISQADALVEALKVATADLKKAAVVPTEETPLPEAVAWLMGRLDALNLLRAKEDSKLLPQQQPATAAAAAPAASTTTASKTPSGTVTSPRRSSTPAAASPDRGRATTSSAKPAAPASTKAVAPATATPPDPLTAFNKAVIGITAPYEQAAKQQQQSSDSTGDAAASAAPATKLSAVWAGDYDATAKKPKTEEAKARMAAATAAARSALAAWHVLRWKEADLTGLASEARQVAAEWSWLSAVLEAQIAVEGAYRQLAPPEQLSGPKPGTRSTSRPAAKPAAKPAATRTASPKADQQTRTGTGESDKAAAGKPAAASRSASAGKPAAKPATKPAAKPAAKTTSERTRSTERKPAPAATKSTSERTRSADRKPAAAADKPAAKRTASSTRTDSQAAPAAATTTAA
jgi:WD40 repeat protein